MGNPNVNTRCSALEEQPIRRVLTTLRFRRATCCWVIFLWLLVTVSPGLAQTYSFNDSPIDSVSSRTLRLAEVQLSGATRTSLETVFHHLPLQLDQPIDQPTLVEAVDKLRSRGLFETVSFYTRPGVERGRVILVLDVKEHSVDFRWAVGNTDLDGWYLVPAMFAYDNPLGKGGLLDVQWRFGFRHSGALLRFRQPQSGDGSNYWGAKLSAMSTDRPYFFEGVEYRHGVKSVAGGLKFGRHFSENRLAEIGLTVEGLDVSHHSEAYIQTEDGLTFEDRIFSEAELQPSIQAGVGYHVRTILHLDWQHDTRSSELRAGSPVSGSWGRLQGRYVVQKNHTYPGLQADFRAYKNAPGGVLAGRLRGAWVGKKSQFYDRLYLGGMYSVRGFPTQSLSAPGGDTWLWSSSLEYRSQILGDAKGTKLAGVLFVDAGGSGSIDGDDPYNGLSVGAGYGLRMRVWWLDWIGLDVGFPLTDRPKGNQFQVTASIGWSF